MKIKRHKLVVEVRCDGPRGQRQAQDQLHEWIEKYGHTSPGHGFEFISVGVMTGKRINAQHKRRTCQHTAQDDRCEYPNCSCPYVR